MSIGKVIRKYRKEKNMTQEEINGIIYELDEKLKTMTYRESFRRVREKVEQYPNCEQLKHMEFKEIRAEFAGELREKLLQGFRDEETFGFLKDDERWVNLCHQM